jgi:uncharacterized membrane protein
MSEESSSTELDSTWGKFSTKQDAEATKTKLEEAGIDRKQITLETDNFLAPLKVENSQTISNLKTGAIAGGVLGFLVGLSISLISSDFAKEGLVSLKHFQTIDYFAPILGAIVGAVGMSLISGITGSNVSQANVSLDNHPESKRYLILVEGMTAETNLARTIIERQGGAIEEANRR